MAKEPHGWIIFTPAREEDKSNLFTSLAQDARLTYRAVIDAGLRNPETDFDPADYFGYFLPMNVPSGREDKPMVQTFAFGIVHIKDRSAFEDESGSARNAHLIPANKILAVSKRTICYEIEDFFKTGFRFPATVHQYKTWDGFSGWMGSSLKFSSAHSVVRNTIRFLLMTPPMTDESVKNVTDDLIKKIQGGGK